MGRKKKNRGGRPRFPRGTTKAAIHKKIMRERRKVKLRIRAERRQQKQEEKEERMYVRWLLFCKGRGKDKNLKEKDSLFINHHVHRAHDKYLLALQHGIDNRAYHYGKQYIIKRDPAHPPSFKTYRRIWYGGAKQNYIRCDVPKLMKMRWEQLYGSGNTEVRGEREGQWMSEIRREISERERGNLDFSVSDLPKPSSSKQGWYQRQKQIRERSEAPAASDRDRETVGK